MSDAAVGILLENLKQLLQENANLISSVKDEVKSLIGDLKMLKAFLKDSEEKSREYEVVKELVAQIRVLTCEVEDAIDAFRLEAAGYKAKRWYQKLFHTIDHTYRLRQVALRVQTTKTKVQRVRDDQTYDLALHRRDPGGQNMTYRRLPDVEKDSVVGFDEATTTLIDRLTAKTEDLQVISIIGMPGLGKTTLANKVYNDPRVLDAFSTQAWIYVSQTYSKTDLLLSILNGGNQVTSFTDEQSLVKQVCGYLTCKYLIVVDDVWDKKDWNNIKDAFPNHRKGSRILLTSRNESVALHADQRSPPHKLTFLTPPQSLELLRIKVFGQGDYPQEVLKDFGSKIAIQCNGLPLAVVVIAGILQTKKGQDWNWETVANSVNTFVKNEKDCFEVLALSYYDLPPHLKPCFLYFGVFPKEYSEIPVWILIRLWIAEGFVQKFENVSLEDRAEEHLENLVARNLVMVVQRSFSGRIQTCRMHDTLRDFCLTKALDESFLLEIKEDDHSNFNVSDISHRLCIHSGVLEYISFKPCGPSVRSFLCFTKDQVNLPHKHERYIPKSFKSLRVYHIIPISSSQFPRGLEKLVHLTYVAFSGDFTTIPAAMSNLRNLQTLIVETSSQTIDIEANILKMSQFRHLHTNKASQLHVTVAKKSKDRDNNPSNRSVQTLTTITPKSCTEDVLGQTPCLRKLGIRGKLATLLEGNAWSLFDNLTKLQKLVTLKLLNDVLPSQLQGLPRWDKFPPNLQRLTLAETFLDWKHMSVLGMLPELVELKLKDNAFTGGSWNVVDGGFKKLKALQIWKTDLVFWKAKADHFRSLQYVFLRDCMSLEEIPSSLGHVEALRTIKLHQTSSSAAASARKIKQQQQESGVYNGLKVEIFAPDR